MVMETDRTVYVLSIMLTIIATAIAITWCWSEKLAEAFQSSCRSLTGVPGIFPTDSGCDVDASIIHKGSCTAVAGPGIKSTPSRQTPGRCTVTLSTDKDEAVLASKLSWGGNLRDTDGTGIRYVTVPSPDGSNTVLPFYVESAGGMRWALIYKYISKNVLNEAFRTGLRPVDVITLTNPWDDGQIHAATPTLAPAKPYVNRIFSKELWNVFPCTYARVVVMKKDNILAEYIFKTFATDGNKRNIHKLDRLGWMTPNTFVSARFADGTQIVNRISTSKYPAGFGVEGAQTRNGVNLSFSIRRAPPLPSVDCTSDLGLLMCPNLRKEGIESPTIECWDLNLDGYIICSTDGTSVSSTSLEGLGAGGLAPEMSDDMPNLATHLLIYVGVDAQAKHQTQTNQ